jgi:uncharacterized Zn finger protein
MSETSDGLECMLDALSCESMKLLCKDVSRAENAIETAPLRASRKKAMADALRQSQEQLWSDVKKSFSAMYAACCSSLTRTALCALTQNGEASNGIVNLAKVRVELQREDVKKDLAQLSELQMSIASCKVSEHFNRLTQIGETVFNVIRIALVDKCPAVAALYDSAITDADVQDDARKAIASATILLTCIAAQIVHLDLRP